MINMLRSNLMKRTAFLFLLLALTVTPSLSEAYTYESFLPDWSEAVNTAVINNNGYIAGYDDALTGFYYDADGNPHQLTSMSSWSYAWTTSINNNNNIVGYGENSSGDWKSYLYNTGTGSYKLVADGLSGAEAYDINDSDYVVGKGYKTYGDEEIAVGFIYNYANPSSTYTTLRYGDTWNWTFANAINNSGVVVGGGNDGTTDKAFIYNGTWTSFMPDGWYAAEASDINNNGTVVGKGSGGWFSYNSGEEGAEIITHELPAWISSVEKININNNGDVAGWGYDSDGYWTGFAYSGGEYANIKPDGWLVSSATGINDDGVIVGYGMDPDGINKGFIATPASPVAPEPVSSILFAVGGAVLAGRRFLKRKN